jgi:RNA polymerase sigma-70 factor (ECF subfamily)
MSAFPDSAVPPEVVARAREGDEAAREAVYRAYERAVRTLAYRLVSRRAAAEDLAQDTFVEVLTSLHQFNGRGSFGGWVRSIALSKCLMHLRSPWHRSLRWLDDEPEAAVVVAPNPVDVDLERALRRLSDEARLVVWLHDVEGYTHAEIGALLGGTPSLSKSQLARAHARLRELLEPEQGRSPCLPVSTSI